MKRVPMFLLVCALALSPAYGQTLFGLPMADSTHLSSGIYVIAVDDENTEKLWFLLYRNVGGGVGNLDPALISTEGDTFDFPEWTTSITTGSGYLFSTGNHGPGDPDTARHWLFIWDKQGHLLHQMPMDGIFYTMPYHWRPEGDIISMCDMHYNPKDHVFDDVEKGSFYFTSFRYLSVFKATIYQDSVWVQGQFSPQYPNGSVSGAFGLVHERTYRGGSWLISQVGYPRAHSSILVFPDTVTSWEPVAEEVVYPRIGEIWSMSGNMEEGLWALAGWPQGDYYRCTAYLFRNPVSVDITFSQAQSLIPSLYPNPTNSWFVLSGLSNKPHDIVIYNLLGQAVYQTRVNGSSAHIDISGLPSGFYFAHIENHPTIRLQLLK